MRSVQVGVPLVDAALRGYNGTLMAYGQTGSGKTYTIGEIGRLGGKSEGVAHRILRHLYAQLDADDQIAQCEVGMQFVQVHLEKIYDLLAEREVVHGREQHRALPIREAAHAGPYVHGAETRPAPTLEAAHTLLTTAASRLHFASTELNAHSSRSHAVCLVRVRRTTRPADGISPSNKRGKGRRGDDIAELYGSPATHGATWRRQSKRLISECLEAAATAGYSRTTDGTCSWPWPHHS